PAVHPVRGRGGRGSGPLVVAASRGRPAGDGRPPGPLVHARVRRNEPRPAIVVAIMSLKVGDTAPEFEAENEAGKPVDLTGLLADGPIALFFYPAAFTPRCTKESCYYRDL